MSVETIPRQNIDHEPAPILSYEEYRGLCDGMQPNVYRETGVAHEEGYHSAIEDDRTVYVELNGKRLPLLVSLEHAGGYAIDKTKALTGAESLYIMALPPGFAEAMDVDLETHIQRLDKNAAIIVETATEDTQAIKDTFMDRLGETGWTTHDFLDKRLEGFSKEEQMARISLYEAHFEAVDDDGNPIPYRDEPLEEIFKEEVAENGVTNTEIMGADRIAKDDKLLKQLWAFHDKKFDELGEYHPVSMQEDEEFFRYLTTDKPTKSIVRFRSDEENNKVPVCQGIMLDGMGQVVWVNGLFREALAQKAADNGEYTMFYYGIASDSTPEQEAHYAKDVITTTLRTLKRKGGKLSLLFESTTMSSLFIPRLVGDYARAEPNGAKITQDPVPISQINYWALVPESKDTVY